MNEQNNELPQSSQPAKMKSKAPFVWILIGVIFGFLESLFGVYKIFVFTSVNQGFFSGFFSTVGVNFATLLKWNLIYSSLGLIVVTALIFYTVKIAKTPTMKNFITTTVLGGLGMFLGITLGGILVLIGSIIGIIKSKN